MTFHLEYVERDRPTRTGGYPTAAAAAAAFLRIAPESAAAAVYEGGGISHGTGQLVAITFSDGEYLDDLEELQQPDWWELTGAATRDRLAKDPGAPLSLPDVSAITSAGGGVVSEGYFPSSNAGPDGFYLAQAEQDWIRLHAVRSALASALDRAASREVQP